MNPVTDEPTKLCDLPSGEPGVQETAPLSRLHELEAENARLAAQARHLEEQLRQAQKLEALGQLAGGIAHDFNNLLTVITGYTELLLSQPRLDESSRQLLAEMKRASERAAALTRQLLAFGRKQVAVPNVLDLNDLALEMSGMLQRLLGEDVLLRTDLQPGLGRILADRTQVAQAVLNLALNARDAMPRGGRLVLHTADAELQREDSRPRSFVLLSIRDSGCGMTDEVKARLFEPFFTTKEGGKGSGLGLAMVCGIVKQAGGHIEVLSEPGAGSTFNLYFPRVEAAPATETSRDRLSRVPRGTETVLLVEDDAGVRGLARRVLRDCGYQVIEAADATEAFAAVKRQRGRIHLLVADVVLPGGGARRLTGMLRRRHRGVKVLYVSGHPADTVARHGVAAQTGLFLAKPFTAEALAVSVRAALDGTGAAARSRAAPGQ